MSSAPNPLMGWAGSNVNQPPPPPPTSPVSPVNASPISMTTPNTNPGNLANPNSNIKDIQRNAGNINNQTGADRNQLIPQFAQLMSQYGINAGDLFSHLANLGDPFYQQKQTEGFNQGVQQNQNAAGQARQQMSAAGTGSTPSGSNIAAIAGMNQAGGQSLAENFLQNLFQNENLMVQGAQGEASVAGMFNPSSLFGSVPNPGTTQGPTAASQFADVMKGLGISGSKSSDGTSTIGVGG